MVFATCVLEILYGCQISRLHGFLFLPAVVKSIIKTFVIQLSQTYVPQYGWLSQGMYFNFVIYSLPISLRVKAYYTV